MNTNLIYRVFGEHAVLLDWPVQIDESTHELVVQMEGALSSQFQECIVETVSTYHSLAIYLKPNIKPKAFIELIKGEKCHTSVRSTRERFLLTIPVCYDSEFARDMDAVMKITGVSLETIITLHTKPIYTLYFMGFLPGFPYLGGLSEQLLIPRKTSPSGVVEKGSVAIGGSQTGIYPMNSPGGWSVIGKTPLNIFDINRETPSIFNEVSKVQFRAIPSSEFDLITQEFDNGSYQVEKEVWRG